MAALTTQAPPLLAPGSQPWPQVKQAGEQLIAALEGRIRELEQSVVHERVTRIGEVQQRQMQIFDTRVERDQVVGKLQAAEAQIQALRAQIDRIRAENQALAGNLQAIQQQQQPQQERIAALTQEAQALVNQRQLLTAQLQAASARVHQLEEDLAVAAIRHENDLVRARLEAESTSLQHRFSLLVPDVRRDLNNLYGGFLAVRRLFGK
ncbi:MAG TPA: hypothetical protein VLF94_01345 [Chlamydiales bacterium]|nr:hypothetical protein [Chlamydiales bacterium]